MSGPALCTDAGDLIRVSRLEWCEVTGKERGGAVTPDTALRLARYFGTTPEFWMELQSVYDLRRAEVVTGESISREVTPRQAA